MNSTKTTIQYKTIDLSMFFLIMLKSQMTSTKAYTTVGLYIFAKK